MFNLSPQRLSIARWLLVLLVMVAVNASARQLVTYTLKYADPQQIQTVVRSYLSPGSSASVYQNQLIVNGTPEELAQVRALLDQLDRGGRQVLISVKTRGSGSGGDEQVEASGSVRTGNGIERRTEVTVTVRDRQRSYSGSGRQGVRATEGQPVYIGVGSAAPINSYRSTADGRVFRGQEYVDATTGFYATAWVSGNSVRIRIDQQQQRFQGEIIRGQQLQTEVSGALGSWIPVGMLSRQSQSVTRDIGGRTLQRDSNDQTIYIRVELLDK